MDLHARTDGNVLEEVDLKFREAIGLCFYHEMECDCVAEYS